MTALDFLFSLERLGMKFGLEHMRQLCAALSHPEHAFRSILVAGTNGKGSVTAMTSGALHAAGYRTARYTSPHLIDLAERFVIGERQVEHDALETAAATVQRAVATMGLETPPTFFECATAIAFELFRASSVEIAVLEVGLGGRLDATNVVEPIAAAITSIDVDHRELLGATYGEIAREKAGVIRPGISVVCGPLPAEAAAVVAEVCAAQRATRVAAAERVAASSTQKGERRSTTFSTDRRQLDDVAVALAGAHQIDNAKVAIALLDAVAASGFEVPDAAVRIGLEQTRWPGRLERTTWRGAEWLIDAAHNPAGVRALVRYLEEIGWHDVSLVVSIMRDKDVDEMLDALLPVCRRVICTAAPTPRALAADALAARVAPLLRDPQTVETVDDPEAAVVRAAVPAARVVVAGSIFLIGSLRAILR